MSLLGSIANFFFPEAGPIPGLLVDYALSDDGGAAAGATAPPAPPPRPIYTGIGASTLDWDGVSIDMNTGDVWGATGESGGFDMGGMPVYTTPPYFPAPPVGSSIGSVIGSVLGAIIPSAQAAPVNVAGGPIAAAVQAATGGTAMAMGAAVAGIGAGAAMVARGMSGVVASALMALRQRLTGAVGSISSGALSGFGRRTYASIAKWIRANPGTSAIGILTGLGLSAEQAAHFLAWGATTTKRSRSRGISGRDMKTARRTIRKLTSMTRALQGLCAPTYRHHHHFRRRKC